MGKMLIKNLKLKCIIGINPTERKQKQDVIINVLIWTDFSNAVKSDNIKDTVNYSDLYKKITNFVEGSSFNLIETLADRIADICIKERKVEKVRVRIGKPNALKHAKNVIVEIEKSKD